MRQSSTSIYIPNFIEIVENFYGRTNSGTPPTSRSRDTKYDKYHKSGLIKFRYCALVSELVVIFQLPLEKYNFRNFRSPVTLILTLDQVIRHTVVHHSSAKCKEIIFLARSARGKSQQLPPPSPDIERVRQLTVLGVTINDRRVTTSLSC